MKPIDLHQKQRGEASRQEKDQEPFHDSVPGRILSADPAFPVPKQGLGAFGGPFGQALLQRVDALGHASTFFLRKFVSISTRMTIAATSRMTPIAE